MLQTWRQRQTQKTRFNCECGSGDRKQFQLHIDDDGCHCLICTGQHDQYAEIQSYKENCDLRTMLNGLDPNVVLGANSTYTTEDVLNSGIADYTALPKTLGGLFNLIKEGENLFNGLPQEVRGEFNNSVKVFASKFGSQEFFDIMNKYNPNPTTNIQQPIEPTAQTEPPKRGRPKKQLTTVKEPTTNE